MSFLLPASRGTATTEGAASKAAEATTEAASAAMAATTVATADGAYEDMAAASAGIMAASATTSVHGPPVHKIEEDNSKDVGNKRRLIVIFQFTLYRDFSTGKSHKLSAGHVYSAIVIAFLEAGNHEQLYDTLALGIGDGTLEGIANLNCHLSATVLILRLDQNNNTVVHALLAYTPLDTKFCGVLVGVISFQICYRYNGNLIRSGIVKSDKFRFKAGKLLGRKNARKIIYQTLLGRPFRYARKSRYRHKDGGECQ